MTIVPPGSVSFTISTLVSKDAERPMADPGTVTRALVGTSKVPAQAVSDIISTSKVIKPRASYDRDMRTMRHLYLGDQEGRLRSVLEARYPRTHHRIPSVTQNIVAETAELDAQVYRVMPERWRTIGGVMVEGGDDEALADILATSTASVLPEAERVACIARVSFVYADVREDVDGEKHIALSVLWPHQVNVIASPSDPSSLWACPVVLLTLTGPGTDFPLLAPTFEAWIRGADGWTWVRFGDEGDVIGSGEYARKSLPVVACCTRVSSSIFPHPDADLTLTQDQVNVTLADHHYRFAMQAHRQHIGLGMQEEKGRQITFGPDVFAMFPEQGASVTSLEANDSIAAFDALDRTLLLHGRSRRQPPDAWHTKGGNPESGISRKIRNEYADQKRAEHVELFALFDVALQRAVHDLASSHGLVGERAEGTRYHVKFSPPAVYEDETTKVDRAQKLLTARLVSPAQAGVTSGAYLSIDEAKAAGLADMAEETTDEDVSPEDVGGGISDATTAEQDKNVATTLNELSLAIERIVRAGDLALLNATRKAYALALGAPAPADLAEIPTPPSAAPVDAVRAPAPAEDAED